MKANSKKKIFPLAPLTLNKTSQRRLNLYQTRNLSPQNPLATRVEDIDLITESNISSSIDKLPKLGKLNITPIGIP